MGSQVALSGRSASLVVVASVAVLFAAAKVMAPILSPILVAMLLALTILPLVDRLARGRLGRKLALLVSFILILAVGLAVISLIGVGIGRLGETLPVYEERLRGVLASLQTQLAGRGIDISGIVSSHVVSAERIAGAARSLIGGMRSLLSGALLILLLVILFVAEMPLVDKFLNRDKSQHWFHLTKGIQKYIGITGLLGFFNALLNLGLLLVLGVDFPVLWAVVCFFFNFVPAVGNLIALTPPALLALLEFGWERALVVVFGFVLTNTAMDLIVKPKLMKTSLDISALVVILSLIFWGWLLGPAGTILAIPLTMVVQRSVARPAAPESASGGS